MEYSPLGAVCTELGLMAPEQVSRVLELLSRGEGTRFGDVAVNLGYLDSPALTRALARQYRLNVLPADLLERIPLPDDAITRVPADLVRRTRLVPVQVNPEQGFLTVVGADPTDLPALSALEAATGLRVRVLLAAPDAVERFVLRAVGPPSTTIPEAGPLATLPGFLPARTVVLEPDERRRRLLERLDGLEDGTTAFARDPEEIVQFLRVGMVARVLYRQELEPLVAPYRAAWHRLQPDLREGAVVGFGPGGVSTVDPRRAAEFHRALLRFLLGAAERRDVEGRVRAARALDLAQVVAERLGLPPFQVEAVALATLLSELEDLPFGREITVHRARGNTRFPLARALLAAWPSPYGLERLLDVLEHRLGGGGPIGAHLPAEVVYTVRSVVRRRQAGECDLGAVLGDSTAHHAPRVVSAVSEALDGGAGGRRSVLVAVRDAALLTSLELRLAGEGLVLVAATHGQEAVRVAGQLKPLALVADLRLPRLAGPRLVEAVRSDPATGDLPVFLLTEATAGPEADQALELGATALLPRPVDVEELAARLARLAAPPAAEVSAGEPPRRPPAPAARR